jgi:hypothetical protein
MQGENQEGEEWIGRIGGERQRRCGEAVATVLTMVIEGISAEKRAVVLQVFWWGAEMLYAASGGACMDGGCSRSGWPWGSEKCGLRYVMDGAKARRVRRI